MKYNSNALIELKGDYLEAGISFWLEEKPRWDHDFHNDLYKRLATLRAGGLTDQWWEVTLGILWQWVALRPLSKQFIRQRGQARLKKLDKAYNNIINKCHSETPSNLLVEWQDVELLFQTAKDVKNVPSPVFASKLCHFLIPSIFPIVDQEVLGGSDNYQDYWQTCKELWQKTKNKDVLIKILARKIGGSLYSDYPWSTKIFELCLTGQRHATTNKTFKS